MGISILLGEVLHLIVLGTHLSISFVGSNRVIFFMLLDDENMHLCLIFNKNMTIQFERSRR